MAHLGYRTKVVRNPHFRDPIHSQFRNPPPGQIAPDKWGILPPPRQLPRVTFDDEAGVARPLPTVRLFRQRRKEPAQIHDHCEKPPNLESRDFFVIGL